MMARRLPAFAWLCLAFVLVPAGCSSRQPSLSRVLHVVVRPSLMNSNTGVIQLTNTSPKPLHKLTVYLRSRDRNQRTSYNVTELKPSERTEIGLLETSWALEPNEEITITCEEFSPLRLATHRASNGTVGIREI